MSPANALLDLPYKGFRDAILYGDVGVATRIISDCEYLLIRKLGLVVCRAVAFLCATLCVHIGDIIRLRPKKQMAGVHAEGVVTLMQNVQAVWNISPLGQPRHSMREPIFPTPKETPIAAPFIGFPKKTARVWLWNAAGVQTLDKGRAAFEMIKSHSFKCSAVAFASQSRVGVISAARLAMVA